VDGNPIANLVLHITQLHCPVDANTITERIGNISEVYTKKMLFNEPKALHLLLDKLTHSVIAYLNQQILSGADSVQSVSAI
jgi:uroporphyrinogen-III decarboxylase